MGRTILVVDDCADIRRIIQHFLGQRGYDVITAPDGDSALAAVAERRPDAIVLDIMMPSTSGLDVVKRLREDHAQASIPVIFVSALSRDADVLNGYQAGGDYYITKPFTAAQLFYALDHVLANATPPARDSTPGTDQATRPALSVIRRSGTR
ncbi:MAG TPA: response regulator [Candidatus Binatia bacterium]|nr:response regulator [Candidatus Binatia bacterium]